MADFTGQQPCAVMDAIANLHWETIRRLNKKFNALKRLTELLEQAGDLQNLVPNIGALIPASSITLDTYTKLQQSCPFLNLPEASEANLVQLKFQVIEAYAQLIARLLNHPYIRLTKVQENMNRIQGKVNQIGQSIGDAIECLQAICDSAAEASAFATTTASAVRKDLENYRNNFEVQGGKVITDEMSRKAEDVTGIIENLQELSQDSVVPAS